MRGLWLIVAIVLGVLALLAVAGGAFSQIIVCEYEWCPDEKRGALVRWWGSATVLACGAAGAIYLARTNRSSE